jgi:hypothetical protein
MNPKHQRDFTQYPRILTIPMDVKTVMPELFVRKIRKIGA